MKIKELISEGYEVLGLGDHSLERLKSDTPSWLTKGYDFCEAMYAQAGVPLSVRQRYAFIVRDREREEDRVLARAFQDEGRGRIGRLQKKTAVRHHGRHYLRVVKS